MGSINVDNHAWQTKHMNFAVSEAIYIHLGQVELGLYLFAKPTQNVWKCILRYCEHIAEKIRVLLRSVHFHTAHCSGVIYDTHKAKLFNKRALLTF